MIDPFAVRLRATRGDACNNVSEIQRSLIRRRTARSLMMQLHNSLTRSYTHCAHKRRDPWMRFMPVRALLANASAKNAQRDCNHSSEVCSSAYNFDQGGGGEMFISSVDCGSRGRGHFISGSTGKSNRWARAMRALPATLSDVRI